VQSRPGRWCAWWRSARLPASHPPPRCPRGRSASRSFLLSDSHSRRSPPRRSPPGRRLKSACFCSIPKRSAFQQRAHNVVEGLRELGWIEGQNIAMRFKFAALNEARLNPLAEELVREKVDLIVAVASAPTRAVSLARSGGNITGLSFFSPELVGKCPLAARWPRRTPGKGHAEGRRSRGKGVERDRLSLRV
jgi:hypothetical protein